MAGARARQLIQDEEGCRLKPYRDSKGKLTIGYGTLIEDGITRKEADYLFENRFSEHWCKAWGYSWFPGLTEARQAVVVSMMYQMGRAGFNTFIKFRAALSEGKYNLAAEEMLDSKWAREDSPERAERAADMMRSGYFLGEAPGPTTVAEERFDG